MLADRALQRLLVDNFCTHAPRTHDQLSMVSTKVRSAVLWEARARPGEMQDINGLDLGR